MAGELLDKAAILTKQLLQENSKSAEVSALLSAVYGMKIGLSPIKGMLLGSKSSSAAQKGVDLAPDNAFTNYVKGSNLFYTPSIFGGDIEKSLEYLKKSVTIYEKNNDTKSWEYLATMALLGQVYHSQKKYNKAITIYETILQVAPNFGYVKMYLLPTTIKAKS